MTQVLTDKLAAVRARSRQALPGRLDELDALIPCCGGSAVDDLARRSGSTASWTRSPGMPGCLANARSQPNSRRPSRSRNSAPARRECRARPSFSKSRPRSETPDLVWTEKGTMALHPGFHGNGGVPLTSSIPKPVL